jgi:hypothetical protein
LLQGLLALGLDPNRRARNGLTALDEAVIEDAGWAIRMLVGADAAKSHWLREVQGAAAPAAVRLLREEELAERLQSQLKDAAAVEWPLPPMLDGEWSLLKPPEAAPILARFLAPPPSRRRSPFLNLYAARSDPSPGEAANRERKRLTIRLGDRIQAARARPVSFYPGGRLVEALIAATPDAPAGCLCYIESDSGFLLLNGDSGAIHRFNRSAPVQLEQLQQAAEYLQFFCSAVHGPAGAFTILTSANRAPFVQGKATKEALALIEASAAPAQFRSNAPDPNDKSWKATAVVKYADVLARIEFQLDPRGMVSILDESQIGGDLPVLREVFVEGVRVYAGD